MTHLKPVKLFSFKYIHINFFSGNYFRKRSNCEIISFSNPFLRLYTYRQLVLYNYNVENKLLMNAVQNEIFKKWKFGQQRRVNFLVKGNCNRKKKYIWTNNFVYKTHSY